RRVAQLAEAAGIHGQRDRRIVVTVRVLLVVGAAVPLLFLTAVIAVIGFARLHPSGPAPGSPFAAAGVILNNLTPLVLLCVGLAGHGVRERSAGYAFAAGLTALVSVAGGYALVIVTGGGTIGGCETV